MIELPERLNLRLIREHRDELRRLTASIKAGTVTVSLILSKLASYPRQNGLALALRELGRVCCTLFTLEWLRVPELRRHVLVGLNKGEALRAKGVQVPEGLLSYVLPLGSVWLKVQSQRRMQATWTPAKNWCPRFSYRVAIARKSLRRLIPHSTT